MTLTAWIITLRGRIREALVPELQVLRGRLKHEAAANIRLRLRAQWAGADAKDWRAIADAAIKRAGALAPDARRGRFLIAKMRQEYSEPYAEWGLTGTYPGDDPESAVDAAMAKERGDE